jgi:mRNA interferase HicA
LFAATLVSGSPSAVSSSDHPFSAPVAISARARRNISVDYTTDALYSVRAMTSQEFKRWLTKQGCTFEAGHGGHLIVRLGTRMSVLPMHGKGKELGTGLVQRIKKDLGLR